MSKIEAIPYEAPTVVLYGTVEELTLGTGSGTFDSTDPACDGLAGQPAGPSGVICKPFGTPG